MSHQLVKKYLAIVVTSSLVALTMGCSESNSGEGTGEVVETQRGQLGEVVSAYSPSIYRVHNEINPTHQERVWHHYTNRGQMSTVGFKILDGEKKPLPPAKPGYYVPRISAASIWWENHREEYGCKCDFDKKDPGRTERACCHLVVDPELDTLVCEGERIDCSKQDGDLTREPKFRADFFNRSFYSVGDARVLNIPHAIPVFDLSTAATVFPDALVSISNMRASAMGLTILQETPYERSEKDPKKEKCFFPKTQCVAGGGTCKTLDGKEACGTQADGKRCKGVCEGGKYDKGWCELPYEGEAFCAAKTDNLKFLFTTSSANQNVDLSPIKDGVGTTFTAKDDTDKIYHKTADQSVTFTANYFDPPAEKAGTMVVVVDGVCHTLEEWDKQDPKPGATADDYFGVTYQKDVAGLADGCHKYYFYAFDQAGREHFYPEVGQLGIPTKGGVYSYEDQTDLLVPVDGKCNSYYVEKRELGDCLPPSPQNHVCVDGETRSCYTDDKGHLAHGACKAGVETCENGRWNGACEGQVLPLPYEMCFNGLVDDNCNGYLDEGCPVVKKPDTNPPGDGNPPGGGGEQNPGEPPSNTDGDKGGEKGCGCSATEGNDASLLVVGLGLFGMMILRRRKED